MALRLSGIFRRGSSEEGVGGAGTVTSARSSETERAPAAESEGTPAAPAAETEPTPAAEIEPAPASEIEPAPATPAAETEPAPTKQRGLVIRFLAWLGWGPEAPADAQEERERKQRRRAERRARAKVRLTEVAEGARGPSQAEGSDAPRGPGQAGAGETSPEEIEARIRAAADAAEQRAIDEIHALEDDLKRAQDDAAARAAELEGRLAESERRAVEAEQAVREARAEAEDRVSAITAELKAERAERLKAQERLATLRQTVQAGVEAPREAEVAGTTPSAEPREPEEAQEPAERPEAGPVVATQASRAGLTRLSTATVEDLQALGMSSTQAKRVLDYRERLEGFDSVDDLDFVPGFSGDFLAELKKKVTL
jgi:DNA uptake protein ComE-like DNA-binding protein